MKIAGVISGTSLDGIDVAICEIRAQADAVRVALRTLRDGPVRGSVARPHHRSISARPRSARSSCQRCTPRSAKRSATRSARVAGATKLDAVASHGVTLAHDGAAHHTLQLGDRVPHPRTHGHDGSVRLPLGRHRGRRNGRAARPVRRRAAVRRPRAVRGPEPRRDRKPDGAPRRDRLRLGPGEPPDRHVRHAAQRRRAALRSRRRARARAGTADAALLERMLDDAYFAQPPPKSTGREEYGAPYVARWRQDLDALAFADAVATLTALTARTVSDAIRSAGSARGARHRQRRRRAQPRAARRLARAAPGRARRGLRRVRRERRREGSDRVRSSGLYDVVRARSGVAARHGRERVRACSARSRRIDLDALLERVRLEDWGGGVRPS